MRFIKIPRKFLSLKEGTKFIDVLVYAAIVLHTDAETGKSRIGIRTIAEKYNISKQKVEEAVERLKKGEYLNYSKLPSSVNDYVFNEYEFPVIKDFLMLDPELLAQDLKPKERGILIYLQLIAEMGINDIVATTIEDIANRIGVTRQTMSKHLKNFTDKNQITKGKYYYQCHYLAKEPTYEKPRNDNQYVCIMD